jgi:hypothetical protein
MFLFGSNVFAMTSTNFSIPWDNLNEGGNDIGTSTNFSVRDTIGGLSVGTGTSANYQLSAGYRAPEASYLISLNVLTGNTVSSPYTAFINGTGGTVTVNTPGSFTDGDMIAVVENQGFGELVAIGRVTSILGNVLTVDRFDGDGGAMSGSPSGGDDFVYRLASTSFSFGTVTPGAENAAVVGTSVKTNIPTGYSVYVEANQDLQNGLGHVMTPVTDGSVTAGSEEYGAEVTGPTAVSAGTDLSVTTTQHIIQSSGTASGAISDKVGMIFKLAINGATVAGTYTQTVYYSLTANY